MYRVIKHFVDLQDDGYSYAVGDEFPRRGKIVSEARLNELASDKNKRGIPLIEKVADGNTKADIDDNAVVENTSIEAEAEAEEEVKPKGRRSRKKS